MAARANTLSNVFPLSELQYLIFELGDELSYYCQQEWCGLILSWENHVDSFGNWVLTVALATV